MNKVNPTQLTQFTLFGFADSAVNLSVGVILILSVLIPILFEDLQNARRVAKRRAETASAKAQ